MRLHFPRLDRRKPQPRRIALVLGGGGLKGFAHIGVLRRLEESGITPAVYAGTSIGALMAAAYASGLPIGEMEQRARALGKRDLFRLNHVGMLMERMRTASIYQEAPLRTLIEGVVPDVAFDGIAHRLLVNTVDVEHGMQVVWGLPGLRDVSVRDAVYASCALPGYFPPGRVDGRLCVDGGVIDNLPAAIAAIGCDVVIAVDVGSSDLTRATDVGAQGFASIYMRAATTMMASLQRWPLRQWQGPPMILIRPKVNHLGWLSFTNTPALIEAGYAAAKSALERFDEYAAEAGGIWPRRSVRLSVDRARCTGCGTCVAHAPELMGLDNERKAFARTKTVEWSPAAGSVVHVCPFEAIVAERLDAATPTAEDAEDQETRESASAASRS